VGAVLWFGWLGWLFVHHDRPMWIYSTGQLHAPCSECRFIWCGENRTAVKVPTCSQTPLYSCKSGFGTVLGPGMPHHLVVACTVCGRTCIADEVVGRRPGCKCFRVGKTAVVDDCVLMGFNLLSGVFCCCLAACQCVVRHMQHAQK
jgi:hypothetical protein